MRKQKLLERQFLCLADFEKAAKRHLPQPFFEYIAGGAETNQSLRDNAAVFSEYGFIPRYMVDVRRRDTSVSLLGRKYDAPFGIAPMGIAALWAYRGDIVLARAARRANIPMILSGSSLIALEEIARENEDAWFQAYLPGDDEGVIQLVERASAAGYRVLVITADCPVGANRENNVRAGFSTPVRPSLKLAWQGLMHPRWTFGTFLRTLASHGMPHFENNHVGRGVPIFSSTLERDLGERAHINWRHLEAIRRLWRGQLVVKGLLDVRDAKTAVGLGADAIVVSNHGGRQLDGAISPLRVLPRIVSACPETPIIFDSGLRRGSDVLKALALGARFVLLGRSFAYAASVAGEEGVMRAVHILKDEVSRNMALMGLSSLGELNDSFLERIHGHDLGVRYNVDNVHI
ncbi:alpha-hydroxy acid oxidase [Glaciimonas sp. CA11.2]|uniref:alpha-hydroxy acid oxidase n=1 Tax=Glaciimonas sp. CA11.2 TaxID=3048601 RepID=UPI002AB3D7D5|nr:alpha-hydroxy acid oxidase [Glaciimonas sp. CA11.2]MDY7547606.1 alpha-hydroxy acid oxidase [Glaciimonas sp. CA11.2]MEB0162456.1 alpha-hydroxy acid oxidase [Glaciimonas sp. CA11.2]